MPNITLIIIPGPGARTVEITDNMSISDLISQESLHGRDIIINGTGLPASEYSSTTILSNSEIFATGSVKGNSNK